MAILEELYPLAQRLRSGKVSLVRRFTFQSPDNREKLSRALSVYTPLVYTRMVLDDLLGFDWGARNVGHVAAHEVMPQEVEEAARGRHVVIPAAPKGGREALEVAWQGGVGTLSGCGVHHPPETIPHRTR